MSIASLHHVAIQTADFDRAVRFYVDVLGARVLAAGEFKRRQSAWLSIAGLTIELFSKRAGESLQPWSDFYSGPVHLAFVVDDLDAFLEAATRKGARLHPSHPEPFVPPVPDAPRIAYLLGPDGEEIELRPRDPERPAP